MPVALNRMTTPSFPLYTHTQLTIIMKLYAEGPIVFKIDRDCQFQFLPITDQEFFEKGQCKNTLIIMSLKADSVLDLFRYTFPLIQVCIL